jgi:hypothetical protein
MLSKYKFFDHGTYLAFLFPGNYLFIFKDVNLIVNRQIFRGRLGAGRLRISSLAGGNFIV